MVQVRTAEISDLFNRGELLWEVSGVCINFNPLNTEVWNNLYEKYVNLSGTENSGNSWMINERFLSGLAACVLTTCCHAEQLKMRQGDMMLYLYKFGLKKTQQNKTHRFETKTRTCESRSFL